MAILKCKMCGGDLNLVEGVSTAECEYCGSVQTVPKADNEKKLTLFARANRLRTACEFDKAAGIYETIIADFPEEAEAYWGLVLCKYGIEYVDDPGTGKKIPTCHRSSFDSIMEDSDFEQTLENADPIARAVYREEAKQFERLRKGILEVSSTEKPYDIFICYKETDENGKRTLDSVLAQDLYGALTDKGYRVFFSRITLKGILGVDFEPYIFAALNSAKVMLAVGTCYEHYNGVWVKNEWSRFLKLCSGDKSKHLIPCYKNLDPEEDMPKEFKHLQGADLGAMGAIQDILFNMEKYIPLNKQTIKETPVFVGGSGGDNKIASLLDRGNMALEDGDWDKADSFFEDVLNNDSKNAQAYLGKTLVVEKCRTLDALICKLKDACQQAESKQLYLQEDNDHIDAAVQKYAIEGYVNKDKIRKLYEFDLSYSSTVESRKQQCNDAETWWKNHKWLSRAEKFAAGESAQILQQARNDLFSALNARIAKAEQAELEAYNRKLEQYQTHLKQVDEDAQELFTSGSYARQMDYEIACGEVEKSMDLKVLNRATETLRRLSGYKDSDTKYEEGLKKIGEITVRQQEAEAAERERKRTEEIAQAKRRARAKATKRISMAVAIAAVAVFAFILFTQIIPGNKYNKAVQLYQAGDYKQAFDIFLSIKNFKDSLEQAYTCADALELAGDKGYAAICFAKLGEFNDARQRGLTLWSQIADRDTINGGNGASACIKSDGSLCISGHGNESFYSDLVAIDYYSSDMYLALKADGTVISGGDQDTSSWTDIVAVAVSQKYIVGLKSDGTVVALNNKGKSIDDVSDFKDIVAISATNDSIFALKADGTVDAIGHYGGLVVAWTDIISISCGSRHIIGLKSDGTVKGAHWEETYENYYNTCEVSEWKDIIEICTGASYTMGLKADGTVVAVGNNHDGVCNVADWTNIVHIAACDYQAIGLKADGTVVAVGTKYFKNYDEVHEWTDIKIPE